VAPSPSFKPAESARPFVRWWWFSGPIDPTVLTAQLEWAQSTGFGGVEIAWVYPRECPSRGARFLSAEWTALVVHAKRECERLGLGCDFTLGSLWPFGGSFVPEEDGLKTFDGPSPRRLEQSWEDPFVDVSPPILDHVNRGALERYVAVIGAALTPALAGRPADLFCDSWELPSRRLWSPHLRPRFQQRFGYDLIEQIENLESDPHLRYDYRAFLADAVLDEFYRPFTAACHELGARSRVQCHGAPTDLIAAYASVDVPESEALLFPPEFSRIAASAAALAGRPLVSCETFTCIYGFPGAYLKQERIDDLKLLADAVLAQGVNRVVWHGMPYNPPGGDFTFFATTHVGPDASFAADLPAFNAYLTAVCSALQWGRTDTQLAVYLPLEDNLMRDRLPPQLRTPAAHSYWEMRQERISTELEGFLPLWVSGALLAEAQWENQRLRLGETEFEALILSCSWLEARTLDHVLRLAEQGLAVVLTERPRRPGRAGYGDRKFENRVDRLMALPNVHASVSALGLTPRINGTGLPPLWVRTNGRESLLFVAHPGARDVHYPMTLGQANTLRSERKTFHVCRGAATVTINLHFAPGQSHLVWLDAQGRARVLDLPRVGT
jgi:hypothetical protein